ncbi:MAG: tRNA lysidine(34) synthetase TilS [Planctomycetota bacterium JB042]
MSGGADSIHLLDTMLRIAPARALLALHVDHRARPGSEHDAAWVAEECRRRGVAVRILPADPTRVLRNGRASEGRLRDERYRLLERGVRDAGAAALYLAHQRDDRVEGIVLALLRGAGPRGLAGVRRRRPLWPGGPPVVRPLLDVPGDAVRATLRSAGTGWREDPTNRDLRYARNRIRHRLLPALRDAIGPDLDERLVRLARRVRIAERRARDGSTARHRRLVEAAGRPLRRATSLRLQEALDGDASRVFEVAPDRRLRASRRGIEVLAPPRAPAPSTVRARVTSDPGGRSHRALRTLVGARRREAFEASGRAWLDADRLVPPLRFRPPRAGDRYVPIGRRSPVKLKTLWSGFRVPAPARRVRWVLEDRCGILAVEGLPPADRAALTRETRRVLRLRFRSRESR